MSRPDYLFLIGVGRSGTTVLRYSLGLHPYIYYTGTENNIVTDVIRAAFENCAPPERSSQMLVSQGEYDRIFERALNELLWQDPEKSATRIRTASFAMPPELPGYLLQVFPNARILHMVRNGIEVIASRQLFHAFQGMPFAEHCTRWARAYAFYEWGKRQRASYRLFRYEWFGEEARLLSELEGVYEWLEIPWDGAPLKNILRERYHPTRHPYELEPASAVQSASDRTAFVETRAQRWQYWSDDERAAFESICGEAMSGFGYAIPWHVEQHGSDV
jgi:hypothetical protein